MSSKLSAFLNKRRGKKNVDKVNFKMPLFSTQNFVYSATNTQNFRGRTPVGHEHPSVADSKYNLALLHKKRKETDIARQLFLECEQIYTLVYGPHHRETVDGVMQASLCV